jgi:hypothetical protein
VVIWWWVALGIVLVLVVALIVAIARDPGPSAADVALGYEHAWDQLDFDAVFRLSGPELRDGLGRSEFVAAKRAAHRAGGSEGRLIAHVGVEESRAVGDAAVVVTHLDLRDGTHVRNEVGLARRAREWQVVAYSLRPSAPS